MSEPAVPDDIDALFKLPLGEFTAARNALAAELKKAGRQAEASEVKVLVKPSASAWVVNQLYWRHRRSFDRLIDAGERLRRAHAAKLTGDAVREPVNARREVMAELLALAEGTLRGGNHNVTRDLTRRVTATLEALSSYASLPGAPVAGRLTDDLEPPGFEAVAQIQLRLPHAQIATKSARGGADVARRDKEQRTRSLADARAAVREAERSLNVARKQAQRAATKSEAAASRAEDVDRERAEIEKQLARLTKEAEAAHAQARATAAESAQASQAARRAEDALELARGRPCSS